MNSFKIHIREVPGYLSCDLFIYRFVGGESQIEYLTMKDGELLSNIERREYGAENNIKPIFRADHEVLQEIAKGFMAYANEKGFKNNDESHAKGKLESMDNHLQDLRRLLKLDHPLIINKEVR